MNTHRESSTITNAACVTLQVSSTCINNIDSPNIRSNDSGRDSNGGSDGSLRGGARSMDKEGEEGPEDDYIYDFPIGHDLCRRYKGSSGNVGNTRRPIQAEDVCYPMPTTTSI